MIKVAEIAVENGEQIVVVPWYVLVVTALAMFVVCAAAKG